MIKEDLHILMLEDDPLDADLNKAQFMLLEEYNCIVEWVADKNSYLMALQNRNYDIIISDYHLPQYSGLDALNDLNSTHLYVPFIFVTGTINEETAAGTIKKGAWDYVVKDRLFRLPLAIRAALQLKEERVYAETAIEKNRQLSMAIEQSPVSVVISNIHHKIEYVNARFTEVTGFLPEEVLGKDIFILTPDEIRNSFKILFNNELKEAKNWQGEIQSLKKDRSMFWEYISISPLKNGNGETTHFIAIKEDITKRKAMELELIEALNRAERSDKLKEAFLQNLSHEIRTPLNAIVGFSDLLQNDREKDKSRIEEYTKIISDSSYKLLSVVTDVLTIASIQTGQESIASQMVDINVLFDRLFRAYSHISKQKNLNFKLSKDRPDHPFFIKTDETKLEQILTNLLNNAFKFTHSGTVELKYFVVGDFIEFYVKDTGIGINKESLEVIFERFRQADDSISTKYGGTGLGLSVESELNKGSVFCLTLNCSTFETHVMKSSTLEVSLSDKHIEILIAEDEINNYLLLEAILASDNIIIHHARNGIDAVTICEQNPSINLVLMDIKMPVMDGETAFIEIRKFRPDLPIIAQTAYALEEEKQHFIKLGFDGYLAKPIIQDDLFNKINSLISLNK
jgi:PAS domain S-box-containing protein